MGPIRNDSLGGKLWEDFRASLSDLTGMMIQVYNAQGRDLTGASATSPLCVFLGSQSGSLLSCRNSCYRKMTNLDHGAGIVKGRCYAGLSYRIIPVLIEGEAPVFVQLGKVFTDISGDDQLSLFAARFKLDWEDFSMALSSVRYFSEKELDRLALVIQRLARYFRITNRKAGHRRKTMSRSRRALDFLTKLWMRTEGGRELLEGDLKLLCSLLGVDEAALVLSWPVRGGQEVVASYGLAGDQTKALEERNLEKLFHEQSQDAETSVSLVLKGMRMQVVQLMHEKRSVGYLLFKEKGGDGEHSSFMSLCCQLMAPRVDFVRQKLIRDRRAREVEMFCMAGSNIFSTRQLDGILPLALDTAMKIFNSERGSIFLGQLGEGRIEGTAMYGSHAELSGKIKQFPTDSVTYRVFNENRSLLVKDASRASGDSADRNYPYTSRSYMSVPISDNGKAIGVIHLTDRADDDIFTSRDLSLLDRFGLQTAVAIRRVTLEDEVESLRLESTTDHLTGIYNRRFLESRLQRELDRANRFEHPLSAIMLDIDNFKRINDEFGHQAGDRVLKELTETMSESLRGIDVLSRYGGEEFSILLPETGLKGAISIAEKLRARIEGTSFSPEITDKAMILTVSMGVATFPDMAISSQDLLQKADQALYEAKKLGKNTVSTWSA